ncbi:uncharacterized protein LOC129738943 [Uranotaenia lowii]|uniref:uncharacterized protein LOC129738943 n=1 Tax=Uranotaenia lowii TaxID=190385 RepID=UPI0024793B1B|nr:uncharacterized protein LOC129738943 [Uranotaenia lowii]
MEFYAIYLPYKEAELSIKSFYTDKEEALKVLKAHKEARLKAFRTSEQAVDFYLNGPEPIPVAPSGSSSNAITTSPMPAPKSPTPGTVKLKLDKTPFKGPKPQELVAFRKNVEKNELALVQSIIQANPRFLVSSGDMPTILKEGPRYNALHVAAMEGNVDMCKLILQTIENPGFIELLHGQRTASTDEVSAILLDMYLNMPDKSRGETPLHFAAKFGCVGVVEVLISYPQCKLTKNSDGHMAKDIICSRAKEKNNTPENRKAITDLLQERFFVPVLRSMDNSTPPVVGDPFTLTNPPNLEAKDKFSPKLEIMAFAGPMDKEKAQVFCKRWKTPPRLIPSPKFISPVKALSSSKIPIAAGGPLSPLSSTPIVKKTGRRTLFPNRSFELALEQEEQERINSINNNFENEVLKEEEDQEVQEEKDLQQMADDVEDEKNGNSGGVNPSKGSFRIPALINSPVKGKSEPSSFLFRKYRERLQNSFATIYDEDGNDTDGEEDINRANNDTKNGFNELDAIDKAGNDEVGHNFSYFCDENNSFYEGTNITESPSFKERKLRLTDTEKGLEIIGRNLAEDHDVGWNEYWNFLGKFANFRTTEGLTLLEEYLSKRQRDLELAEQDAAFLQNLPISNQNLPQNILSQNPQHRQSLQSNKQNDSLRSLCDAFDKFHVNASPLLPSSIANLRKQPDQIRSNITNPYLCLHNSLQIYAKRFVKNLDESSTTAMTMDFGGFFHSAVVDCVRKLNSLVDNYRKDAAFGEIDFGRVHSRYAQLVVIGIERQPETAGKMIHRLMLLLDKSRELNSASKYPDLHDSLVCLQNFLDLYIHKKEELVRKTTSESLDSEPEKLTETGCSRVWQEDPLIRCCSCRIDAGYTKKGSLERLNKRREQRRKVQALHNQLVQQQQTPETTADYNRANVGVDVDVARSLLSSFTVYRDPKAREAGEKLDDEDEEYFSCSDTEPDSDSDDANVSYETPPSSPSFFSNQTGSTSSGVQFDFSVNSMTDDDNGSAGADEQFMDSNGDLEDPQASPLEGSEPQSPVTEIYKFYLEGQEPSKQDLDVLNVIELKTIDESQFPHVHKWREAILKLPVEERESLVIKWQKSRWRSNNNNYTALSDQTGLNISDTMGQSVLGSSPPSTPVGPVATRMAERGPAMFRFAPYPSIGGGRSQNDSMASLDARLSLMNISDYDRRSGHQAPRHPPLRFSTAATPSS